MGDMLTRIKVLALLDLENIAGSKCLEAQVRQRFIRRWEICSRKLEESESPVKFLAEQQTGTRQDIPSKIKNKLDYLVHIILGGIFAF